ncbi:DUF2147 domain-containing protein [Pedobacter suwonensis]|uniref:DUF2147 domain-containing protein n=2 Tax=Pedobacter suwonensis TaxID=332999 RepID=UPI00368F1506
MLTLGKFVLVGYLTVFGLQVCSPKIASHHKKSDLILGDWISVQKNVMVNVAKENGRFKATVTWFSDKDDPSRPMESRMDVHNPDPALRHRKLLGMEILKGLNYNEDSDRWEDGIIYDPLSGRDWSSVVSLEENGLLKVKGYWHFEFLSKSISFKRVVKNK